MTDDFISIFMLHLLFPVCILVSCVMIWIAHKVNKNSFHPSYAFRELENRQIHSRLGWRYTAISRNRNCLNEWLAIGENVSEVDWVKEGF